MQYLWMILQSMAAAARRTAPGPRHGSCRGQSEQVAPYHTLWGSALEQGQLATVQGWDEHRT